MMAVSVVVSGYRTPLLMYVWCQSEKTKFKRVFVSVVTL